MRSAVRFAALAAVGLSACGFEEWPRAGSGPTPYGYSTDAGARPGPFDPSAGAGIGGRSTGGGASVPPSQAADTGGGGDRGTTRADGGGTEGGGTVLQCGAIQCSTGQYCLIETNVNPITAPPPQCLPIPAGCSNCECLKPFTDCLCGPQAGGGGFVVSCP